MAINDFEISLEENAMDFLTNGIEHYIDGVDWDLKYAVINIAQAIELFLKARLAKEHRLLVYSKPENCDEDSHTVNLEVALSRLLKVGVKFENETIIEIKDLAKYRNKIIHNKITADENEITHKIGKGVRFLEDFLYYELSIILKHKLDENIYNKLNELIRTYSERVEQAKEEMYGKLPSDKDRLCYEIICCPVCSEMTIAFPDDTTENPDEVHCYFCKETFHVWSCSRCGEIQFGQSNDSDFCDVCWHDMIEYEY